MVMGNLQFIKTVKGKIFIDELNKLQPIKIVEESRPND